MPCFGEKINVTRKNIAAVSTIAGPEAQLNVKLKYKPITDEITENVAAKTIMCDNRFVNKNAVAAGVINMATIKIIPTVCKAVTVTSVNININA